MRGNRQKDAFPLHIVSAYSVEDGLCFGQTAVKKSNEITAVPKLLKKLNIKGHIITIDAMGTQCAMPLPNKFEGKEATMF